MWCNLSMFSMPLWQELGAVSHGYRQKESKLSADVLVEPRSVPRALKNRVLQRTLHRPWAQKVNTKGSNLLRCRLTPNFYFYFLVLPSPSFQLFWWASLTFYSLIARRNLTISFYQTWPFVGLLLTTEVKKKQEWLCKNDMANQWENQ